MAWIGMIAGIFGGLLASILGYTVWSLPLWFAVALYPIVGTAIVFATIGVLILRTQPTLQEPPAHLASDLDTPRPATA